MQSNTLILIPEEIYLSRYCVEQMNTLNTIHFTEDNILGVIGNLDPNKAHRHDQTSIRMIQMCDNATCKPLYLIFSAYTD